MAKYIFKEDYEAKGTNPISNEPNASKQASFMLTYSFKKGDVFEGKKIPINAGINPSAVAYAVEITTTEALKADGTKWSGKAIFEVPEIAVTEQTLTTDVAPPTFFEEHKNHLLLVGALVLGYLAYKKFNK